MTLRLTTLGILAAFGLTASAARAADLPSQAEPAPPPVLVEGWQFQATLYGWATSLHGDVGVRGLPPADVDVSFVDILDNLDGAIMGSLYASNGKWMVLTDLVWAKLSDTVDVGPFGGSVTFEQKQAIASAVVGYALPLGIDKLQLSPTVGLRYNHLNAKLDIDSALLGSASREGTKNWVDPTVGMALHYDINDRWFINGLADIGGFGVGSKITSQGFATVGYNWSRTISTAIGYRAIYTNYKDGGFVYKTTQQGPFASLGVHF